MSDWDHVSSQLGRVRPETREIAHEIYEAAYAAGQPISFIWGFGGGAEHGSGLALDFMVPNKESGDFVRDYIWANRERLRLRHVIWWQHITSTVMSPGVVRPMADRGDDTQNHYDHVHVWFYEGEYTAPEGSVPIEGEDSLSAEDVAAINAHTTNEANRVIQKGWERKIWHRSDDSLWEVFRNTKIHLKSEEDVVASLNNGSVVPQNPRKTDAEFRIKHTFGTEPGDQSIHWKLDELLENTGAYMAINGFNSEKLPPATD